MTDSSLVPLMLLYTKGRESIDGATRFQKLVFLAQEEGGLPQRYHYHADRFGPYSYGLQNTLDRLQSRGLIEKSYVTNEYGNEKHIFSLTTAGIQKIRRIADDDRFSELFDRAQAVKQEYNDTPIQSLLQYVYRKYPTYRTETEIDLDTLFDPDTDVRELQEGEPVYAGPGPDESLEVNPSAEDLFSVD